MREEDIKFFKIIVLIICICSIITMCMTIYNNTNHKSLTERNQDYIDSLK